MQNFGRIKNTFNGILAESVVTKQDANKQLFKKYVKAIKESKILTLQFLVYNNIENKVDTDSNSANFFVNENLKLLEKFKIEDIIKENAKLVSLDKSVEGKLNETYKLSELHESLSKLITTKRTANSIDEISKNLVSVVDYIKTNKVKEINEVIDLPTSMISSIMVDKYNKKYSTLDESEKLVLKALIESTDEEKKTVYSTMVRECIDLINVKLKTSDTIVKDKLLSVKDKLLNDKQEIDENFNKNISKLVELKNTLK